MDKTKTSTQPRRTQGERSQAMRERILDATLDCLMDLGLRQTSTVAVARHAGVSRGALMHHYPTKILLLQEALRYLLINEIEMVEEMAVGLVDGEFTLERILDVLWEHFSGRLFMVTIEYIAAARTDEAIRETLAAVGLEFNQSLDAIWDNLPRSQGVSPKNRRLALNATLCFLRGMGTQTVWRDDPDLFNEMLVVWKQLLAQVGVIGSSDSASDHPKDTGDEINA